VNFTQGDFRFGTTYDVHSMMGGGLCWLDYNNDGRLDLFVVNSYSDADASRWTAKGGLPRSALFENVGGGRFANVSGRSHANPAVQGNGCVAADLNGDGHTDLLVTTNTYNVLLWNNGDGTFSDGTHAAGSDAFGTYGWHTGATVADVNGDGRPDIFVSGYADVNALSNPSRGFPSNYRAFRDLLYLNEGSTQGTFTLPGRVSEGGIETKHVDHSLGAVFTDVNGDGRPIYVANDLDPNRLYINEPGGRSGSISPRKAARRGSRTNAGMGVAARTTRVTAGPTLRDELARPGTCRLPGDRGLGVHERPVRVRTRRRPPNRLGRLVGRRVEQRAARPRLANGSSRHEPEEDAASIRCSRT
jgi:hypothetical protein